MMRSQVGPRKEGFYTDKEIQRMNKLRLAGNTFVEIGAAMGYRSDAIRTALIRRGLYTPAKGKGKHKRPKIEEPKRTLTKAEQELVEALK